MIKSSIQLLPRVRSNQSLKLTEVAVDDSMRAKRPATIGRGSPRADWIPSRGTSSPQLSSGPLGGKEKLRLSKKETVSVIQVLFFDLSSKKMSLQAVRFSNCNNCDKTILSGAESLPGNHSWELCL